MTECLILFIRRDVRYVMTCFRQEYMGSVPAVTHIFNIYGNHGACDAESLLRKMRNSRSFEAGRALFVYDGIMQESMARFKYSSRREYGAVYAEELYRHYGSWVKQTGAGMLVPVPVHPARYRRRGYNQAEILARHFGKLSGLPVGTEMIARIKDTRPQKELSAGERKRNLAGAFSVGRQVRELNQIPECVIIMDDIYTTGSTMEACSAVLKETGIRRIYFLCVCIGQGN